MEHIDHTCSVISPYIKPGNSIKYTFRHFKFCPFCGEELDKTEKTTNSIIPKIEEIIRAHDILDAIVNDLKPDMPAHSLVSMTACLTVLCWLLGHNRGQEFIEHLVNTEAELAAQGLVFSKEMADEAMREKKKEEEE